eukprot:1703766-Ditylum_brightwellii.AAC.1
MRRFSLRACGIQKLCGSNFSSIIALDRGITTQDSQCIFGQLDIIDVGTMFVWVRDWLLVRTKYREEKKNGRENDKKRGYHTSGRCREERESQLKSYYGCDGVKESLHRVSSLFSSTTALIFTIVFEISNSLFSKTFSCSFLKGELPQQEEERELEKKEDKARSNLRSSAQTQYESGVNTQDIPKHIAVIMDGNRRYGRKVYGSATKGHWDGSKTLVNFAKWCLAEQIQILTVYAFSTENWNRSAAEISSLMTIFLQYCEELRTEAIKRDIRIHVLSTDKEKIPKDVRSGLEKMERETQNGKKLIMNVCLSYGSR